MDFKKQVTSNELKQILRIQITNQSQYAKVFKAYLSILYELELAPVWCYQRVAKVMAESIGLELVQ